jgi:hypothetical protein
MLVFSPLAHSLPAFALLSWMLDGGWGSLGTSIVWDIDNPHSLNWAHLHYFVHLLENAQ